MHGAADSEKAGLLLPFHHRTWPTLSAPGPQPATPGISGCLATPRRARGLPGPSLPAEEEAGAEEWETWAHFLSGQGRAGVYDPAACLARAGRVRAAVARMRPSAARARSQGSPALGAPGPRAPAPAAERPRRREG